MVTRALRRHVGLRRKTRKVTSQKARLRYNICGRKLSAPGSILMPSIQDVFQTPAPVALVTGSGSARVGRVVAEHLARLGCDIALHANTSVTAAETVAEQLRSNHKRRVIVTSGSLLVDDTPRKLVQQTFDAFGRVDILVNCAAIWSPKRFEELSADDLREYFQINSIGSFLCAQQAGLLMVAQPTGGSIVNIGDWATGRPYLDHAAYFPSKGSIETMTRSLAVELAHRNSRIRVNCIQPGPVLLAAEASEATQARIAESTLLQRLGTPEHVAHAVQFLCENDFVTGVCLPVDGGRSIFASDGLQVGMNTG
jgi:pteridine reductase